MIRKLIAIKETVKNRSRKKDKISVREIYKIVKMSLLVFTLIFVVAKVESMVTYEKEPEITNAIISEKMEVASGLTTAQLTYNGLVYYSEGEIPFFTQKAFSMMYCAEVEAGVDLSKAKIHITDTEIKVTFPEINVLDIKVDYDSIRFFDERTALFNWSEKEDVVDVMQIAEEDVRKNADVEKLKGKAKEQTEILITGLLEEVKGERRVVVIYQ